MNNISYQDVNQLIEYRFNNPVNRYVEEDGTYPSLQIYKKIMSSEWNIKMLGCHFRQQKNDRFDVTLEELYAIAPDYFGQYRVDWGRGENSVTDQLIKDGKITRDFAQFFKPQLDHIDPISKSNNKKISNLAWESEFVNRYKSNITKEQWPFLREELDRKFKIEN